MTSAHDERTGPLTGVRVLEIASLGPVPFAGMLLADLGAELIRVDRPVGSTRGNWRDGLDSHASDLMGRGKSSISIDLKQEEGRELLREMVHESDVLTEGLRPGAMERLDLGPDELLELNPRLIYARVSGWGRQGALATAAGHDLNYLALSGVLGAIGHPHQPPDVPLNLIADFGGGGMFAAMGICAALHERAQSGRGQVVDHSMLAGSVVLSTMMHGMLASGRWSLERAANELDGGAPHYRNYGTSDGRYVSVGAIEPQFYRAFMDGIGLDVADWPQADRERWPALSAELEKRFAARTRDEWAATFDGTDACVTPILDFAEAADHGDMRAAGIFVDHAGIRQPGIAPEFSRTPGRLTGEAPAPAAQSSEILARFGMAGREEALRAGGVVS